MYKYICIYIYVYMYLSISISISVSIYNHTWLCIYMYICICMYVSFLPMELIKSINYIFSSTETAPWPHWQTLSSFELYIFMNVSLYIFIWLYVIIHIFVFIFPSRRWSSSSLSITSSLVLWPHLDFAGKSLELRYIHTCII